MCFGDVFNASIQVVFPAVKAAHQMIRVATAGGSQLVAAMLTHVVERMDRAILRTRDQDRFTQVFKHEIVARFGHIAHGTGQQPRLRPDVLIFQLEKGRIGVAVNRDALGAQIWVHSIKSLTFTAAEDAVSETFANAYGDHSRYTKNYLRWSKEKKIKKFKLLEPHISMYTKVIKISPVILQKKNDMLQDKLERMQTQLNKIASGKKDDTKIVPDDEKVRKVLKFMEEQNLL